MTIAQKILRYFVNGILKVYNRNRLTPTSLNVYLERLYFLSSFRYMPKFDNPQTINEYFVHLKLFGDFNKLASVADKYAVREKIKNEIGEKYLLRLYDVVDDPLMIDEARYQSYPEKFVAKPNHASGRIFVNEKYDYTLFQENVKDYLREFGNTKNEFHYKIIKPKLLIEEFMEPVSGTLYDFKFYLFNGNTEYVMVGENYLQKKSLKLPDNRRVYTLNWVTADFQKSPLSPTIDKPDKLDEMIDIAETLSKGWRLMRVDLYLFDDKVKFGEMTPIAGAGRKGFIPQEYDRILFQKHLGNINC